jgi:WhiB family transcriptional regulator, redox-sensing transcriptional regulator
VPIQQLGSRSTGPVGRFWRDHASCRLMDPELFFPPAIVGVTLTEVEDAKAVCHACPVQDSCLQFAFETKQEYGIWGGTTEDDRRRLRRVWLADRRRGSAMSA